MLRGALQPDRSLARYLREGRPHGQGVLEDYAYLIAGLLDLFELRGEPRWLDAALALQRTLDARFWDDAAGGYWQTPAAAEPPLLLRSKPVLDESLPSPNAVADRFGSAAGLAVWPAAGFRGGQCA